MEEPAILVCLSESTAKWFKDGYELDESPPMNFLFFESIKPIDQGQYTCTGTQLSNEPIASTAKIWVVRGRLGK